MAAKSGGFGGVRTVVGGGRGTGSPVRSGGARGPARSGGSARAVGSAPASRFHEGGKKGVTLIPHARPIEQPPPSQTPNPAPATTPAPTTTTQPAEKPKAAIEASLQELPDPPISKATLPRVYAYMLADGHNVDLWDHLRTLTLELDRASEHHVDLVLIGDPELSGPASQSHRSAEESAAVPAASAEYVAGVVQKGRERNHVVQESLKQARFFGIPEEVIPCFVLVQKSRPHILATIPIEPAWSDSEAARRAVGRALIAGLRGRSLIAALMEEASVDPVASKVPSEFGRLGDAINREVFQATQDGRLRSKLIVPSHIVLEIDEAVSFVRYRTHTVELTLAPFKLLRTLAQSPGRPVDVELLAAAANPRADDAGFDAMTWAKQEKLRIMKSFRAMAKSAEIRDEEVNGLITGARRTYKLNLEEDVVLIH